MKDPKVEKLVEEFKQTLTNLNQIHAKLVEENVWVDLARKDKEQSGWEIRHLKQTVEY
jgi:hypothetical protein